MLRGGPQGQERGRPDRTRQVAIPGRDRETRPRARRFSPAEEKALPRDRRAEIEGSVGEVGDFGELHTGGFHRAPVGPDAGRIGRSARGAGLRPAHDVVCAIERDLRRNRPADPRRQPKAGAVRKLTAGTDTCAEHVARRKRIRRRQVLVGPDDERATAAFARDRGRRGPRPRDRDRKAGRVERNEIARAHTGAVDRVATAEREHVVLTVEREAETSVVGTRHELNPRRIENGRVARANACAANPSTAVVPGDAVPGPIEGRARVPVPGRRTLRDHSHAANSRSSAGIDACAMDLRKPRRVPHDEEARTVRDDVGVRLPFVGFVDHEADPIERSAIARAEPRRVDVRNFVPVRLAPDHGTSRRIAHAPRRALALLSDAVVTGTSSVESGATVIGEGVCASEIVGPKKPPRATIARMTTFVSSRMIPHLVGRTVRSKSQRPHWLRRTNR